MPRRPSPPDELLRAFAATPRATGSAALHSARQRCATELTALGYVARERPFEFSSFPGRFGTPLIGVLSVLLMAIVAHIGARGDRFLPLAILAGGGVVLGLSGRWLASRGLDFLPIGRRKGVNLDARRDGDAPAVWLCAHLDTKSQPVPTLVRTAGVFLLIVAGIALLALAVAAAAGAGPTEGLWLGATVMTLAGGIPVVLSVVGDGSNGALDNASGVAAVLAAAQQLGSTRGVGILITDAEELGLAGARAWARDARRLKVLNCDGVDDTGMINVLYTGQPPQGVLGAARAASQRTGVPCRTRRIPVGILMDSVAFTEAGLPSVSFSRGTYRSLARVHSASDSLDNLRGTGIDETATLIAATARMLLGEGKTSSTEGATH